MKYKRGYDTNWVKWGAVAVVVWVAMSVVYEVAAQEFPMPTAQCQTTIGGTPFFPVYVPDDCLKYPTRVRTDGTVEMIPIAEWEEMQRKEYEENQK